jgi:hypothetical protein
LCVQNSGSYFAAGERGEKGHETLHGFGLSTFRTTWPPPAAHTPVIDAPAGKVTGRDRFSKIFPICPETLVIPKEVEPRRDGELVQGVTVL